MFKRIIFRYQRAFAAPTLSQHSIPDYAKPTACLAYAYVGFGPITNPIGRRGGEVAMHNEYAGAESGVRLGRPCRGRLL